MTSELPAISIVVIGRNEGDRLVRCLESIRASDYSQDKLELIYVDTASTDDSCARAEQLGAKVVAINPQRPSAATARNAGFAAATHDFVHFFDGDTILSPDWLRVAVKAMDDPKVACVFGQRSEIHPQASIYNFIAHHDWYTEAGPTHHCAGDAIFRREVLVKAKGYDETLIAGEEPDLCYRIRREQEKIILSVDHLMTHHDMNMMRFGQYWRRTTRTGHAYAEVGGRYADMHWRRNRWRNPVHVLIFLVAVILAGFWQSPWPMVAWFVLIFSAIFRNAWRMRERVGSLSGSLVYSAHHYFAKLPMTVGACSFWLRGLFGRKPQPLIEYK